MKKFLLPNKCWLALAFVALLAVGCGLRITSVEFSTHEPEAGSTMTVKANLKANGDNQQDDYVLFYAIRVPSDWEGLGLTVDNGGNAVEMTTCEQYAQLCEFCYPRDGYKWVGYQSTSLHKQAGEMSATVELKVGQTNGDYTLDIMGGGWKFDPADMIKDGEVNIDYAFGHNLKRDGEASNKNEGAGIPATRFHTSEYLFNTSTISAAENQAREDAMAAEYSMTAYGKTMPIAPDIANVAEVEKGDDPTPPVLDLSVKVKGGAGVENVAVDAAEGAAEYFDLQGRKVAEPKAGLYLVKRGGKVAKEIIK